MQNMVQEILNTDILKITPNVSVEFAVSLALYRQVEKLYVVDDQQHLLGIVPAFSLVKSLINAECDCQSVEQIMSRHVVSCEASINIAEIAPLFREACHESIAVVHQGQLIGQLLRHDILQWLSQQAFQNSVNTDNGVNAESSVNKEKLQIAPPQFLKARHSHQTLS